MRINVVSPSIARHKFLDETTSAELLDRLSAREAFGRAAEPWEVAATIGEVISVSNQHPSRSTRPGRMIRETDGWVIANWTAARQGLTLDARIT